MCLVTICNAPTWAVCVSEGRTIHIYPDGRKGITSETESKIRPIGRFVLAGVGRADVLDSSYAQIQQKVDSGAGFSELVEFVGSTLKRLWPQRIEIGTPTPTDDVVNVALVGHDEADGTIKLVSWFNGSGFEAKFGPPACLKLLGVEPQREEVRQIILPVLQSKTLTPGETQELIESAMRQVARKGPCDINDILFSHVISRPNASTNRVRHYRGDGNDVSADVVFRTNVETLDNVLEGSTFGRTKQTALTSGEVDLSKAGVIQKVLDNISDSATRKARTAAHSSYRPLSNPLTATDAGATTTVNIAAFTMRAAGQDVSVNSGSISSLAFGTLYYIYYDDASFAGGSVTFSATTSASTALNGTGRFFVGSIVTPKDSEADTRGNNDGGATVQIGGAFIHTPPEVIDISGWTNPANARDVNTSTFASHSQGSVTQTLTGRGVSGLNPWSPWPPTASKVTVQIWVEVTTAFVNGSAQMQYDLGDGSGFVTYANSPQSVGARTLYEYNLTAAEILAVGNNHIQLRVSMPGNGGAASGAIRVYEMRIRVEE